MLYHLISFHVYYITDWQDKQLQQINKAFLCIRFCHRVCPWHLPKSLDYQNLFTPTSHQWVNVFLKTRCEIFSLSVYVCLFLPTHFLSLSLCLTRLQKDIWFLFATEGLDDFNAKKRKAALNCDEISKSSKYEPSGHDLLVIANVFVCICSDWGLFKESSFIAERVVVYESTCVCKREKKRCFSSQTQACDWKNHVIASACIYTYNAYLFIKGRFSFSFSFPKISQYAFAMHILKLYCPQRK